MTPEARVAAAIDILDLVVTGRSAEQALTRWARQSRFAGSKDRAAVRDLVFDVLRHWRSDALRGGSEAGRGRMIGRLRAEGRDLDAVFTGQGYAPTVLSDQERALGAEPTTDAEALDVPDWIWTRMNADVEPAEAQRTARAWQSRAPITIRVNAQRITRDDAQKKLRDEGIETTVNTRAPYALTISDGERRLRNTQVYKDGLVELQDASSQAVVSDLPEGRTALDFCAGGGGKALALAAMGWSVTAHDEDPRRMADLPDRAHRARVSIPCVETSALNGQFDVVLCDAPCSGSGSWRRSPQGKWQLTQGSLNELLRLQCSILDTAMAFVAPGGTLVYATCSVFNAENEEQTKQFLERHLNWALAKKQRWSVDSEGDGFFSAHLTRTV